MTDQSISPEEHAFLRAISENPEDDLPRLVYADWIEDRGRTARAEFIRLQVERYRRSANDRSARGISWREYELLQEHEVAWREELPPQLRRGASFRRGFVFRLQCSMRDLIESTRDHALLDPIERLEITVDSLDPEWLAYHPPPLTFPLSEVRIDCELSVGPILILALVRYGPFPKLKKLIIRDRYLSDDAIGQLRPDPTFPVLEELDLSSCGLSDRGAEELAESDWVGRLKRLRLAGNTISSGRQGWLRSRFGPAYSE
jgi:uncharacterized protein (TIGR02996 family)